MSIRNIQFPDDLQSLGDLVFQSFTYPENTAWSVQEDEKESLVQTIQNMQRFWPLINFAMWLSPALRDQMCGVFWEQDGKLVGSTMFQRRSSTAVWLIATVGVLPTHRRRGIARKLVESSLEEIRHRGGRIALLDVIEGNLPAFKLYESMGFEVYSGIVQMSRPGNIPPPRTVVLPTGYSQHPLSPYDWETRYDLDKRITPANLLKYEPVEPNRYQTPPAMRLMHPILLFSQGLNEEQYFIKDNAGQVVARFELSAAKKPKGFNSLLVRLDPTHPDLGNFIISFLLARLNALSPGLRIQLDIPRWQEATITAAESAGFVRRMAMYRMGLLLN